MQLGHQLLVLLAFVADGLECVAVLVLFGGKLAQASAQILVFFRQHFNLLLNLSERKKFRARVLAAIQFPLYLILILPDSRDDLVHLLEEFAFAGRAAHRLAEFVVNRGQQRELFVQIDFSVLQRVVQQVIAVQFRLLLVDCQL